MKLYQKIAGTLSAMKNCEKINNDFYYNHQDTITDIERNYLPHGSGFDGEMNIIVDDKVTPNKKYMINFDWHCMGENGGYDGWLNLTLVVTPCLLNSFNTKIQWYLKVSGNDKNKVYKYKPLIEDFLYEEFGHILSQEYEEETS